MRSSNPMFRHNRDLSVQVDALSDRPMSSSATMSKLLLLSLIMIIAATAVFYQFSLGRMDYVNILTIGGAILGFIFVLILSFVPKTSPYLAPLYAFSEGAFLSGISCQFNQVYPGIVVSAVSITLITVSVMALLHKFRIIKATEKFRSVMFTAVIAIGVFYLISFVLSLFNVNIPYFTSNSNLAIIINVIFALVAAFYLIIDFDNIELGEQRMLPSLFEWYYAVGLLVTIVWLYLEVLRLLARLQSRD